MKRMKKKTIGGILGGIVGVGLLVAMGIAQSKPEDMQPPQVALEQTEEVVQQALDEYDVQVMRTLTEEEQAQLVTGELSVEEAAQRIIIPGEEEGQPNREQKPAELSKGEEPEVLKGPTEQAIVTAYTAKMYALQSKYTGKLSGLEAQGWQLLGSYKSGSQSIKALMPQGMGLVRQAMSLEAQCDNEVETLLQQLSQELQAIDATTEIVSTMKQVYHGEKLAKKRYYLSLIPQF